MRHTLAGFCLAIIAASAFAGAQAPGKPPAPPGIALADISWKDAETALTGSSVVVIPLGAAAVQHGPHLKLNNNERLARYLASRVQAAATVVIAPTLTYHFYPSFLEYPGSTTLSEETARNMTVDIVRSVSKSGPRRFYVLNTGRTVAPLSEAAKTLANDGILLGYTDPAYRLRDVVELQQSRISVAHADEVATSMMLFVDPSAVDMKKAVREYASGTGALTRIKDAPGVFSESGVLGDATVATREKGQVLVDALLAGALEDIENIRKAPLPIARTIPPAPAPTPAPRPAPGRGPEQRGASGCTPGDERTIRAIGEKFQLHWRNQDVPLLMSLFAREADMRHPDGTIERTAQIIAANRVELFKKREYRGSVHTVALNDIRCLSPDIAIADGKWELRMETSPLSTTSGRASSAGTQIFSGWCTLVLRNPGWSIEAWRYTVDPATGPPPPTVLKQPGFLGRGGGVK